MALFVASESIFSLSSRH